MTYVFHFYMDSSYSIQTNNAKSVCGNKGKVFKDHRTSSHKSS